MKRDLTELKRLARETLTGHYAAPMAGIVITGAISNLLLLPFDLTLNNSASQSVIFYVASFFIVLLSILFSCGLCYMHLKMRRNLSYGMRDIFYFFKSHPDRLLLSYLLLIGLAVLVFLPAIVITVTAVRLEQTVLLWIAIPVFILSALCLLPLLYRYAMVFYLLIDHPEMKPAAAFHESSRLMKGNRMRLFLLHCSFLGWLLLGICSCFIGFLWIEPYFEQTCVSFYFELTGENDALAQKRLPNPAARRHLTFKCMSENRSAIPFGCQESSSSSSFAHPKAYRTALFHPFIFFFRSSSSIDGSNTRAIL